MPNEKSHLPGREETFRVQMARLRDAAGWTQTELARRLKSRGLAFHQQTVQRIESGERPIRLEEAFLIARELGSSVEVMILPASILGDQMNAAVEAVKVGAYEASSGIESEVHGWFEAVAQLEWVVDRPYADRVDGQRLDDLRTWGLAWALKAEAAATAILKAVEPLSELGGVMHSEVTPNWHKEIARLQAWRDSVPKAAELEALSSEALTAARPLDVVEDHDREA